MFEASQRGPKSAAVWKRVCQFIQDHESRIHVETQFIDGEETLVWKWVATTKSPFSSPLRPAEHQIGLKNTENSKSTEDSAAGFNVQGWQGDAFDRSQRPVNSPTPCLKVLHFKNILLTNSLFSFFWMIFFTIPRV